METKEHAIPMENVSAPEPKPVDPWAITDENDDTYIPWSEKTKKEKFVAVIITIIKTIVVFGCLYLFICSLGLMGSAFQVLAGKTASDIFSRSDFLSNPVTEVIIGILVTVLVQSSSTSTSIFITMTAAGLITIRNGIPLIMGANIGTSVTNTIVSLSQSVNKEEFRKAFAGATVHDIFNLLSVLILLPLELVSHYLEITTGKIMESFDISRQDAPDLLKVITKPLTKKIIAVNKTIIKLAAKGEEIDPESSMINVWCKSMKDTINITIGELVFHEGSGMELENYFSSNSTGYFVNKTEEETVKVGLRECDTNDFLFANTGMTDAAVGSILLIVSLIAMCICLVGMVKLLSSMLRGSIARIIKKIINSNFPRPFGWVTGYLTMIVGAGLTILVQSSSVFTSTMTPLVGIGVISLKRMFPLTLGSNIGTTTTGILAALAADNHVDIALQLALCHFFFNVSGIIIWYPIPFMRKIPINAAKALGNTTAKHRWFALVYLIVVFFLLPALFIGLSYAHLWALWGFLIVVAIIVIPIIVINVLQSKFPAKLPQKMRTWDFLPLWMHSFKPYDKIFTACCRCRKIKSCFKRSH